MTNAIHIEGIKVYAYHGCLEEEAKIGGNYIVDVFMQTDFTRAARTDDLGQTIDYCEVYELVKSEMAIRSKLIEQVGQRIYDNMWLRFPELTWLKVKVTKLLPPMNGDVERVSIEISS